MIAVSGSRRHARISEGPVPSGSPLSPRMTVQLIDTRRKQLGRRFFVALMILILVGVLLWLFYQTGVFQPLPPSQPGR
jgi:hypothetical protein